MLACREEGKDSLVHCASSMLGVHQKASPNKCLIGWLVYWHWQRWDEADGLDKVQQMKEVLLSDKGRALGKGGKKGRAKANQVRTNLRFLSRRWFFALVLERCRS